MESIICSVYNMLSSSYQISELPLPILRLALTKMEQFKPPKQPQIDHSSTISQNQNGEKWKQH